MALAFTLKNRSKYELIGRLLAVVSAISLLGNQRTGRDSNSNEGGDEDNHDSGNKFAQCSLLAVPSVCASQSLADWLKLRD